MNLLVSMTRDTAMLSLGEWSVDNLMSFILFGVGVQLSKLTQYPIKRRKGVSTGMHL